MSDPAAVEAATRCDGCGMVLPSHADECPKVCGPGDGLLTVEEARQEDGLTTPDSQAAAARALTEVHDAWDGTVHGARYFEALAAAAIAACEEARQEDGGALALLRRLVEEARYASLPPSNPDGWEDTPLGMVLAEAEQFLAARPTPERVTEPVYVGEIDAEDYAAALADPKVRETLDRARSLVTGTREALPVAEGWTRVGCQQCGIVTTVPTTRLGDLPHCTHNPANPVVWKQPKGRPEPGRTLSSDFTPLVPAFAALAPL